MNSESLTNPEQSGPAVASSDGLNGWVKCTDRLPPNNVDVETKIDDGRGVRNVTKLRRYSGLWFLPDMSMYVYYVPTHWREAV